MRAVILGITLTLVAALGAPLAAHHSFAPFNLQAEKTVTGTIKQFDWTNPHTWVWIDIAGAQGGTETWAIEGMSPNFLGRRGWTKSTFKPGDKVSIVIRPMRDGSKGGMFVRATLSDGRVLTSAGEPTDP
jgi:hypothetical protein